MTGAVIALAVKEPLLAIPLSFISHYLTDAIPHFSFPLKDVLGRKFNIFHTVDFLFSIFLMAVMAILFPEHLYLIWACMIAAAIPDLGWWFDRRTVKKWPEGLNKLNLFHWNISKHISHFYYDAAWFVLMWILVIIIKLR